MIRSACARLRDEACDDAKEVLARIDAEQGHRPNLEVAVYPCAPLQVLQPAGLPATLAPAT